MKRIQGSYEKTTIINKSRFIAQAFRVDSIKEIEEILAKVRKKYYDATHNCYAYRLDENTTKMSDDGEPAKTAGAPILDVLIKQDITNILVVVTRYFGGILLGAGGLVRAYSSSTAKVLEDVTFYTLKEQAKFSIVTDYSSYQTIIKKMNYITIEKTSFGSEVTILGYCPKEQYENIQKDCYNYKLASTLSYLGVFPIEIPGC